MINRKSYHCLLLCALLLSACAGEDTGVTGGGELQRPDTPVPFALSSVYAESIIRTRADAEELDKGKTIGFYARIPVSTATRSQEAYVEQGNVKGQYDNNDNKWQPVSEEIWLNNRTASIAVYAPFDDAQPTEHLNLSASLLKTDKSNDIVAGSVKANNHTVIETGVSVTLSHIYTSLQFSFVKDDNYPSAVEINKLEMTGDDIFGEASYDPITGTYTPAEPKTDVSLPLPASLTVPTAMEVSSGTSAATVTLLLIPIRQTFGSDAYLWVNTKDGKRMKLIIKKETFSEQRPFASGKQYKFSVKLSPAEMEITGVEIADWAIGATVTDDTEID